VTAPDPHSVARRVQEACAKACDAVRVSVLGHGHEVAVAACRDAIRALSLALPPTTGDAEATSKSGATPASPTSAAPLPTEPAAGTRWPSVERRLKHERQFPNTPPPSKGGEDDAGPSMPEPVKWPASTLRALGDSMDRAAGREPAQTCPTCAGVIPYHVAPGPSMERAPLTKEERAVVSAAMAWRRAPLSYGDEGALLTKAVDALLAASPRHDEETGKRHEEVGEPA
jgi:hypothetical protein